MSHPLSEFDAIKLDSLKRRAQAIGIEVGTPKQTKIFATASGQKKHFYQLSRNGGVFTYAVDIEDLSKRILELERERSRTPHQDRGTFYASTAFELTAEPFAAYRFKDVTQSGDTSSHFMVERLVDANWVDPVKLTSFEVNPTLAQVIDDYTHDFHHDAWSYK